MQVSPLPWIQIHGYKNTNLFKQVKRGAVPNSSGLEARWMGEVGHAVAKQGLTLEQGEELVRAAHSIRGKSTSSGLGHRFKLWQRYIFTILINGLRKAETTATSLECRAFGLYPTRTYVKDISFNPWDLLLIVVTVVLSTGLVFIERMI